MNRLWTFGCSFTEEFISVPREGCTRWEYIDKFFNGTPPETWVTILANQLGYEPMNRGAMSGWPHEGNCNDGIFNNICHYSNQFKKGDMVIVEWTFLERFKWVNVEHSKMTTVLAKQYCEGASDSTMDETIVNKSHYLWVNELFVKQKMLQTLADNIGFDLYYWSVEGTYYKTKFDEIKNNKQYLLSDNFTKHQLERFVIGRVYDNRGMNITDETKGIIQDSHLAKSGHEVLGNLFYKDIIERR